jgi:hypothetical protein
LADRRANDSPRNSLVYAKALNRLPDYSTFAAIQTEKKLGPFIFDTVDNHDVDVVTRGPYELDN